MRDLTYNNEAADDHIMDTKVKAKAFPDANKAELEHPKPKHTPEHQYQKTWHEEWLRRKIKLAQIKTQGQQRMNKARATMVQEITGDQPHGIEKGLSMLGKLLKLLEKYPHGPQMHETELQERDTWANMMLRYTKDKHTQERIARTPKQEHGCETCGKLFLSRAGMKVHQRLKPQCAENMTQQSQNNKECPNKNCNFQHPDPRQIQVRLFYHFRGKHTSRTQ